MVVPPLRSDLEIIPKVKAGQPAGAIVKDPRTQQIFELREEDYFLCRQFDGRTPLATIQARFEGDFGTSVPLKDLESFVRQLMSQGLLVGTESSIVAGALAEPNDPYRSVPSIRWVILDGDKFFGWLVSHLSWLFTRPFKLLSILVISLGAYTLLWNWSDFWNAVTVEHGEWFWWIVVAMVFDYFPVGQFPRTLAHGFVCKRFGGQVQTLDLALLYYVYPGLICHWGSFAWFPEKSKRCWTAFAGIYAQLHIISVATICWYFTMPGGFANDLWLAVSFGLTTGLVVFVANPLLRSDGYQLLAQWVEMPRLRTQALATLRAWVFRQPPPEPLTRRERRWVIFFGLLCIVYATFLVTYAFFEFGAVFTTALQGAGVLLLLASIIYLLQVPLLEYLVPRPPIRWLTKGAPGVVSPWVVRVGLLVALIGVAFVPYPYETGGPFTVLPNAQTEVHCEIDGGRIEQVFVREGDFVARGKPLAQIDQREYLTNLQATQAQLDNTKAQLGLLYKQLALLTQPPNIEQIQSLEAEVRRLRTLVADYQKQLELTTLRAPVTGRVITPMVDQKMGQYLKKGDLFATMEQIQTVLVEIQVPEGDAPLVRLGAPIKIVPWAYSNETFPGTVKEIAPVAAMPTNLKVNSVRVLAAIPNKDLRLNAQITGFAKIKTEKIPVWLVLLRLLIRWFQVQFWYWLP